MFIPALMIPYVMWRVWLEAFFRRQEAIILEFPLREGGFSTGSRPRENAGAVIGKKSTNYRSSYKRLEGHNA